MIVRQRLILGISGAMLLGSLALCIHAYVGASSWDRADVFSPVLAPIAALSVVGAATAIVSAWRAGRRVRLAAAASVLAALSILALGAPVLLIFHLSR